MKTILILVASLLIVTTNVEAQEIKSVALETSDDKKFDFHHRGVGFKVTIYSQEGVVNEFNIPEGAPLHVQFTEETSSDLDFLREGFPLTFLGDVTIRTSHNDQLKVISKNSRSMRQDAKLELSPPYQLNLTDVKVVVEKS